MKNLFLTCLNLLEKGEDVAMVTIIDRNGSAPRTAGSRMPVRRDGAVEGTIGGGLFEAEAIRLARSVFQSGQAVTRAFCFSGSEVHEMDMICGIPESMDRCMRGPPVSENSCIVIATRGHAYDGTVLAQALRTDAGYIGMIGSRRKRDMICRQLRLSGAHEALLARVHPPIGTDIEAETPEEIAVSIIGELIQARARRING